MSGLVGNPEDRFSHNEAHIAMHVLMRTSIDQVCPNSRHVLCFGDFNARTARLADYTDGDKLIFDILGDESLNMEREETFRNFENAGLFKSYRAKQGRPKNQRIWLSA